MTEAEARSWMEGRFGSDATERVAMFLEMVRAESGSQNLISEATLDSIWARHAVDSAQLLTFASADWDVWLDVGTGGGFPGMVIALLAPGRRVVMVEPRRRRAAFLEACVEALALPLASVRMSKVEAIAITADVISARAVAQPHALLAAAAACAHAGTTWLLPRGRSGEPVARIGSAVFHVEHSLTDSNSLVYVGKGMPR